MTEARRAPACMDEAQASRGMGDVSKDCVPWAVTFGVLPRHVMDTTFGIERLGLSSEQ